MEKIRTVCRNLTRSLPDDRLLGLLLLAVAGNFTVDQSPSALPQKCRIVVDTGTGALMLRENTVAQSVILEELLIVSIVCLLSAWGRSKETAGTAKAANTANTSNTANTTRDAAQGPTAGRRLRVTIPMGCDSDCGRRPSWSNLLLPRVYCPTFDRGCRGRRGRGRAARTGQWQGSSRTSAGRARRRGGRGWPRG